MIPLITIKLILWKCSSPWSTRDVSIQLREGKKMVCKNHMNRWIFGLLVGKNPLIILILIYCTDGTQKLSLDCATYSATILSPFSHRPLLFVLIHCLVSSHLTYVSQRSHLQIWSATVRKMPKCISLWQHFILRLLSLARFFYFCLHITSFSFFFLSLFLV